MKHPPAQNLAYASISDNSVSPSAISETIETPHTKRISGPRKFRSSPQKDFCNRIKGRADIDFGEHKRIVELKLAVKRRLPARYDCEQTSMA
jgi:hypothetical protein